MGLDVTSQNTDVACARQLKKTDKLLCLEQEEELTFLLRKKVKESRGHK